MSDAAAALARAFLAGEWSEPDLVARGSEAVALPRRDLRRLVRDVVSLYERPPRDRERELAEVVEVLLVRLRRRPRVERWFTFEPAMGRLRWPVPEIATPGELADFLELSLGELQWLADARGLERRVDHERLRHYRYDWFLRPRSVVRVIERPKRRLKEVQRRILRDILAPISPHEAAHGFRGGRSVVTHAAAHTGRRVVIRLDLEAFFASVEAARVYGIFRAAGYPESVAHALTALCTNVVPARVWAAIPRPADATLLAAHARLGARLAAPHLPQGAPTSPALANLAAFGVDARLTGLAESLGATYTRYADDLAFSGDDALLGRAPLLRRVAASIVGDEGFRPNERKSQLTTRAGRQRLCGVVVNVRPNVARREYDLLKAIVHDAARNGPAAANRACVRDFRAHLLGRIAWVAQLNPPRGRRLRERFEQIVW
jgi:hypothetical protein